jgi:hypothetical protein
VAAIGEVRRSWGLDEEQRRHASRSRFSPLPIARLEVHANESAWLSHTVGPASSWSHASWTLSEYQQVRKE